MQTFKVSQIAEILGTTVKTINNHRNKGKLSTSEDGDGHQAATPVEIQRAYGDKYPDIGRRIAEYSEGGFNQSKPKKEKGAPYVDDYSPSEKLTLLEKERARERGQLESQIDHLKEVLQSEQDERRKITAMLTDKTQQKENRSEWERSIKALESRVANQEKLTRQNQALRKALHEEKSKGFFKKLFG